MIPSPLGDNFGRLSCCRTRVFVLPRPGRGKARRLEAQLCAHWYLPRVKKNNHIVRGIRREGSTVWAREQEIFNVSKAWNFTSTPNLEQPYIGVSVALAAEHDFLVQFFYFLSVPKNVSLAFLFLLSVGDFLFVGVCHP